jgi:hypothetical protein
MSSFFKGIGKELDQLGKSISREVDHVSTSAAHTIDAHSTSPLLEQFRSGNVVQLVSRSSGKALQIVMAPAGHLVVDGCGPEGPQVYHAHWTVVDEGKNIVKLHNNNNFLAIINGVTQVMNFAGNPMASGAECKFRLSQTGQFVRLESYKEAGRFVGVLPAGELKSALATGKDNDACFGVRLIYKPVPVAPPKVTVVAASAPGTTTHHYSPHGTTTTYYAPPGSTVTVIPQPRK